MTDVLSQGEIENDIRRLSDELESLTETYAQVAEQAGDDEVTYKVRAAKAFLAEKDKPTDGRAPSEKVCDARATVLTEHEQRAYRRSAAVLASCKQALTTKQARLDAMRTLSANVRRQT